MSVNDIVHIFNEKSHEIALKSQVSFTVCYHFRDCYNVSIFCQYKESISRDFDAFASDYLGKFKCFFGTRCILLIT